MAISRILANKSSLDQTEDDAADLISLIAELNMNSDLAVKLSSTSKIAKILQQVDNPEKNVMAEIKNSKTIKLGAFQSKLRLEMKSLMIDPRVREIMDHCRAQLESIQGAKDCEIEEFMEEHAEGKFKAMQEVKKKF